MLESTHSPVRLLNLRRLAIYFLMVATQSCGMSSVRLSRVLRTMVCDGSTGGLVEFRG